MVSVVECRRFLFFCVGVYFVLICILVNFSLFILWALVSTWMTFGCRVRFSPIPGSMFVCVCFWVDGVFCFVECRSHNCSHVLTFMSTAELRGPLGSRVCDVLWCVCLMFEF